MRAESSIGAEHENCHESGSNSSDSSSSESEDSSGSEADMCKTDSNRPRVRKVRSIEEKTEHWRLVRQPEFQSWARATLYTGCPQPVPEVLSKNNGVGPSRQMLLLPPVALERSISAQLPAEQPTSPTRRWNDDGTLQTFVAWQDEHGRTSRGVSQASGAAYASSSEVEKQILGDAVKRRANEQCMQLYVDCFTQRQMLRRRSYDGGEACAAYSQPPPVRMAVAELANRFDAHYGKTQEAMHGRLGFRPPTRSHSVSLGQMRRYVNGGAGTSP